MRRLFTSLERVTIAALLTCVLCALSLAQQSSRVVDSIVATTCAANTWVNVIAATGAATCAQPAQTNLSDYTATTWTPTLIGSGTPGASQTYSTQVGSYEKIGRQYTVRFALTATSLGTAAGDLLIGNLPVANNATTNDFGNCFVSLYIVTGLAALTYGITGFISPSATSVNLRSQGNTISNNVTIAQSGQTPTLVGMCNYHI